jgi:hypothetical protein
MHLEAVLLTERATNLTRRRVEKRREESAVHGAIGDVYYQVKSTCTDPRGGRYF